MPRPQLRTLRKKGFAVLAATRSADGRHLVVWCPFCANDHTHTGPGLKGKLGDGDGHRIEHCTKKTPFTGTGYWVFERKK